MMAHGHFSTLGYLIFTMVVNEAFATPVSLDYSQSSRIFHDDYFGIATFKKVTKPTPTPAYAPLNITESIQNEIGSLNAILIVLGASGDGIVGGSAGISIHDCAAQIKGQDLNSMTCEDFIDALSKCESLMHVKDLLEAAKKIYEKKPNSKKPCFE